MSIAEIQESREWLRLSIQQRACLAEYLSGGREQGHYDIASAIRLSYPKVENKRVWASRLQSNPRVKAVLALYFGDPTKDLRDDIKALIRRSKRKNSNRDLLLAPWLRCAALLEAIATKGNASQELSKDVS
jgi:DNA primase catalytic subunit